MQVTIHAKGVALTSQLRQYIRGRLRVALGRVGAGLERVDVFLEDLNGPRGGVDKRCAVEIAGGGGVQVFEQRDADVFAAVHVAFDKARTAVARSLARSRGMSRRGGRRRTEGAS